MVETESLSNEFAPIIENKDSVKLAKNSKGYVWEIKLKDDFLDEKTLERLKSLNNSIEETYGAA